MFVSFLNSIGLDLLSNRKETEVVVNDLIKSQEQLDLKYKKLFDWTLYEKELKTFMDWRKEKNIKIDTLDIEWHKVFNSWYNTFRRNEYQAFKIRSLSMHPDLLNAFLLQFSSFDYEDVRKYMEEVNWFWNDGEKTPTIEELKDCVINLIPLIGYENENCGVMSGGFTVKLCYKNNKAFCEILFDKNLKK